MSSQSKLTFYFLAIILVGINSNNFFFWDTVHFAGRLGTFYYDNNFSAFWPPETLDNGHPPFFSLFLAVVWKVFGQSLVSSHLAMLPFVLGIVFQVIRLTPHFIPPKFQPYAMTLIMVDATLLSQSILVSPDIILVFFFLLALNSSLNRNGFLSIIAFAAMVMISNRGALIVSGFFITDLLFHRGRIKLIHYVPAFLLFTTLQIGHYINFGWIGFSTSNSWGSSFEKVPLREVGYNLGLMIWRYIDFGRIFLIIPFLYLLWNTRKQHPPAKLRYIQIFKIVAGVIMAISTVFFSQLIGHRYYLPIYLSIALWFVTLLFNAEFADYKKKLLASCIIIGMLTGNLWRYPDDISQGWDATLGHIPYYSLHENMIAFIDENEIGFESVGSTFNNLNALHHINLSGRKDQMKPKDLTEDQFILYSNIWNEFTERELEQLSDTTQWKRLKTLELYPVETILYQRENN